MGYTPDTGVTFRVRCRTKACAAYREIRLVKMPKQDNVILWAEPRCAKCLAIMETVNEGIARAVEEADAAVEAEAVEVKEAVAVEAEPIVKPAPPRPAPPRPPKPTR